MKCLYCTSEMVTEEHPVCPSCQAEDGKKIISWKNLPEDGKKIISWKNLPEDGKKIISWKNLPTKPAAEAIWTDEAAEDAVFVDPNCTVDGNIPF